MLSTLLNRAYRTKRLHLLRSVTPHQKEFRKYFSISPYLLLGNVFADISLFRFSRFNFFFRPQTLRKNLHVYYVFIWIVIAWGLSWLLVLTFSFFFCILIQFNQLQHEVNYWSEYADFYGLMFRVSIPSLNVLLANKIIIWVMPYIGNQPTPVYITIR